MPEQVPEVKDERTDLGGMRRPLLSRRVLAVTAARRTLAMGEQEIPP